MQPKPSSTLDIYVFEGQPCNAGPHPSDTSYVSAYCPIFDCLRLPTTYCLHLIPIFSIMISSAFSTNPLNKSFQFQNLLADYLFARPVLSGRQFGNLRRW